MWRGAPADVPAVEPPVPGARWELPKGGPMKALGLAGAFISKRGA